MTQRDPGMNRIGRVALLAFGLASLATTQFGPFVLAAEDSQKVLWRDDLGSAQAEAKDRDLLLWIQFTGPWCGNCRRMERGAFVDPAVVVESRERFVPVKLRADEYEALASNLGLTVLPSTVLVRPNGEVVDKWEGYAEPGEFAGFLIATLTREGRSSEQVAARLAKTKSKAGDVIRTGMTRDGAVALAGFDPVSLLQDQKLVPGRDDLAVEHDGQVFRFANEAGRAAFLRKPDSFAPVNGGRCPVSQVDRGDFASGDPRWGVVYDGHLFLFRDVADRDRFAKDPERYAGVDRSVRASCPHCHERSSLTRRLSNRFSTMFAARTAPVPVARPVSTAEADSGGSSAATLAGRLSSILTLDPVVRR